MRTRLGLGEVTTPELRESSAQELFLAAIESHAPEVIRDLYKLVDDPAGIDGWMQRWRLPEWMRDQARDTLRVARPVISRLPELWEAPEWLVIAGPFWSPPVPRSSVKVAYLPNVEGGTLTPVVRRAEGVTTQLTVEYRPDRETRAAARKRLHQELESWLDEVEAAAAAEGWQKAPQRDPKHFEWLVKRHLLGWTWSRIYSKDDKVARRGAQAAAAEVGIELQPGEAGRPT